MRAPVEEGAGDQGGVVQECTWARRRREEVMVRAAHSIRVSRVVWVVEARLISGGAGLEGWVGVHGGGGVGHSCAGEGRSEVDVPLDLKDLTGLPIGEGGVQGELGGGGALLRVDRIGVEGVEVLGGVGVHLAVLCTSCSRCLMTLSTLTSTPSTLTARGSSSAWSLW